MPNARRGEVALQLGDQRYTLCLTLGALAELEEAFGVGDLMALAERFGAGRLSSRDLLALLAVALRGGGHDLSDVEVANLPLRDGIAPVAAAIADLLVATFGGEAALQNPPQPQDAASLRPSRGKTPRRSASASCGGARRIFGAPRRAS